MIISAKIIKNPRTERICECYLCNGGKVIEGEQVRLYGCAETGDKPFVMYACLASTKDNPDIQEALARGAR